MPVEAFDHGPVVYSAAVPDDAHPLWANGHRPSVWWKISQVLPGRSALALSVLPCVSE